MSRRIGWIVTVNVFEEGDTEYSVVYFESRLHGCLFLEMEAEDVVIQLDTEDSFKARPI